MGYIMKNFTGACPETNRVQTISVKFEEIRAAGAARPDCKALGFYCGYAEEHGSRPNKHGQACPLFIHVSRQAF